MELTYPAATRTRPAAFAIAVETIAERARRLGLLVPVFRSPPALDGADRTCRRRRDGDLIVAIRVRGRPFTDVLVDIVDGVLVANHLDLEDRARVRHTLLSVAESLVDLAA
jgi:hypothetical protein